MRNINVQGLNDTVGAMLRAGFPATSFNFSLQQSALETAGFNSDLFSDYNNASGIKYYGSKGQIATGATPGPQSPEGDHYAQYSNLDQWAADYLRVLSLNRGSGRPIDASSLEQYINALHANGYFTDDTDTYTNNLTAWGSSIENILPGLTLQNNAASQVQAVAQEIGLAPQTPVDTGNDPQDQENETLIPAVILISAAAIFFIMILYSIFGNNKK